MILQLRVGVPPPATRPPILLLRIGLPPPFTLVTGDLEAALFETFDRESSQILRSKIQGHRTYLARRPPPLPSPFGVARRAGQRAGGWRW